MVCTWFGEISSCSSLTALPGPAWVLLSKICKPFVGSLYVIYFGGNTPKFEVRAQFESDSPCSSQQKLLSIRRKLTLGAPVLGSGGLGKLSSPIVSHPFSHDEDHPRRSL